MEVEGTVILTRLHNPCRNLSHY